MSYLDTEQRYICDECNGLFLYELELVETDLEELLVCDDCLKSKYFTGPKKPIGQKIEDLRTLTRQTIQAIEQMEAV